MGHKGSGFSTGVRGAWPWTHVPAPPLQMSAALGADDSRHQANRALAGAAAGIPFS